jgi:glucose-1-phosphate adenylyltransferase
MFAIQNTPGISRTPVLILAGGSGIRLLPLTVSRPKPLLPFGPFRIIDFTLLNCQESGLGNVALLTQYKPDQMSAYIRQNWGGQFRCLRSVNGKHYRGTADAVFQNLLDLLEGNPRNVLVLSGDHIYRMDYRKLLQRHVETDADVTIATIRHPLSQANGVGVVDVDRRGRVTGFQEKPLTPGSIFGRSGAALISMGIYVFRVKTLADVLYETCGRDYGYDFGRDILPLLIRSAQVCGYEFRDEVMDAPYWRDIGSIENYYEAAMDLVGPAPRFSLQSFGACRTTGALSVAGLSGSARVARTLLCNGVRIGECAEVEASVLMPGVRVCRDARLRRVIVDENVRIPEGFTAGWDLERDRARYMISPRGIAVITQQCATVAPFCPFPIRERTSFAPNGRGEIKASVGSEWES